MTMKATADSAVVACPGCASRNRFVWAQKIYHCLPPFMVANDNSIPLNCMPPLPVPESGSFYHFIVDFVHCSVVDLIQMQWWWYIRKRKMLFSDFR